jgi:hypothetical protein
MSRVHEKIIGQLLDVRMAYPLKGKVTLEELNRCITLYNRNPQLLYMVGRSPEWLFEVRRERIREGREEEERGRREPRTEE